MLNYWSSKTIIVTGANGFIGSQLVRDLIKKGAYIIAVVKNQKDIDRISDIKEKINIVNCDLSKNPIDKDLIKKSSLIIHTAAIDGGREFKIKHHKKIFGMNIKIIKNILKSVPKDSIIKFIYLSSADVYYKTVSDKPLKESEAQFVKPDSKLEFYAWSKIQGERYVAKQCKLKKINYLIIRPANIFGRGDRLDKQRLVPVLLDKLKAPGKILDMTVTDDIRSFTYLPDFSENLIQLSERANNGTFNLASSSSISIRDFVKIFASYKNRALPDNSNIGTPGKTTILDVSKAKKYISKWNETSYVKSVREILNNLD